MLEDLREIVFYNRINKSLGVKFIIQCSSDVTNEEITDIYSRLSLSCSPMFNSGKEYDLRSICLDTLEMLPGNLDRYPRIIVLYDNSMEDKIYNVDLDNLGNYDGDMMLLQYGELVRYVDSEEHIVISSYNRISDREVIYSCLSDDEYIPSLFSCNNDKTGVIISKVFVESINEIIRSKQTSKVFEKVKKE